MPELIVTCAELSYAGKTHLKGARFVATDKHAKVLKAIKKAADAPAEPKPVRKVAEAVAPPPQVVEPEPAETELARPRRLYSTRRLKADD